MNPTPLVSVVLAVRNGESWLPTSIPSVLNQSFGDFELIVVDDGSTDRTAEMLDGYQDRRLRVLRKQPTSLADSLNYGIANARGKWIARMDADDICLPDRLEVQVAYLREHQQVSAVGGNVIIIDEHGRDQRQAVFAEDHNALRQGMLRGASPFPHPTAVFLRASHQAIGGYDPRFRLSEDFEFWLRFSRRYRLACVQKPVLKLRRNGAGMTRGEQRPNHLAFAYSAIALHRMRGWLTSGQPAPQTSPASVTDFAQHISTADRLIAASGLYSAVRCRELLGDARAQRGGTGVVVAMLRAPTLAHGMMEPIYRRVSLWRVRRYWSRVGAQQGLRHDD